MKLKNFYLVLLFIFLFVSFANVIEIKAMNTGFKTSDLPTEEKDKFLSNTNILLIREEPDQKTISCFDVNNNRLIAIGQNTPNRKTICIYSSEGVFQYGYTFHCSGDFGVEWDKDNINIYYVRSSVIVSVTPNGEILDVLEVQNSIENNSYVNKFIHATERTIGDTTYLIRNDIGILNLFAPSYSQIVVKDTANAESIIYDVGALQRSNIMSILVIVFVTVLFGIVAIVWQIIKLRNSK